MLYPTEKPIEYPTSDGKPMAETDVHREQMMDLIHALQIHFRGRDDVYVSGNLLMFYEEGNRHKHLSPDVLVTLGIPGHQRDHYLIWAEGKPPDLVFEITSRSTRSEDLGTKKGLYALFGIREYCLFDPLDEYLTPRIRLYRLAGEDYMPVAGKPLWLDTVGLEVRLVEDRLRLYDPDRGSLLPTRLETLEQLGEKEEALAERDAALAERDAALAERDALLQEQRERIRRLEARLEQDPRPPVS